MITETEYNNALNIVSRYENQFKPKTYQVSATYTADVNVDLVIPSHISTDEIISELQNGYGYDVAYNFEEEINHNTLKLKKLIVNGIEIELK